MVDTLIPSAEALTAYGLSRYVSSRYTGNNPFIKVNNTNTSPSLFNENATMNEVILQCISPQPVKLRTQVDGNITKTILDYGNRGPDILQTYRILLDADKVMVKYGKHSYVQGSSIIKGVFDAVAKSTAIAEATSTGVQNLTTMIGADGTYTADKVVKLDFQKVYKSSDYPTFDLSFTALTHDNFLGDIYFPLLGLAAYTYPKRFVTDRTEANTPSDAEATLTNTIKQLAASSADWVAKLSQKAQETIALTTRQYILSPPCMFNISHAAGLYTYTNALCNSMSIEYDGPWYNSTSVENDIFNLFENKGLGLQLSSFARSFPTMAKVTMSFETSELITRDDFSTQASNYTNAISNGSLTFTNRGTTTQQNTGNVS